MKKKITAIAIITFLIFSLCSFTGSNYSAKTAYTYNKAIIHLPNGNTIKGTVTYWRDFGNLIQVQIGNTYYLAHWSNVTLIKDN